MESSAVENQGTMSSEPIHPYYPRDLRLPHYVPNEKSAAELVGVFFGVIGGFMVATWVLASSARTVKFSIPQRIILCWFVMSGIIHSVLEGYFGIYHQTLAGRMTFLGQVWKEYSKGDSRYLSSFYRIPAIIRNQGQACETLSSQRRLKWLSRLNQDFTGKNLGNVRVCSDHFIMGKPVDLYDETNPDWAPSLKMGHEKLGFFKTSKDRYERISKRKVTIKAKATEMFPEEELCPNEAPDDSTNTDCNVETQTDLNGFLIDAMSSELQALRLEMMDIKKHVAISKLCLSDLIGKDDKVKFLTGLSSYDVLAMLYEYLKDFIPTKKNR
ncbi:uncharacterized protein LOC121369152 isoform X1 [Gigantopelta aegis]|uniref:uncharacterized protein LOC121369152 isoform X1 n=1 Tax=Gigantopelta aegis TaxID=1735272 RepID=UPI001B88D9FB|nr:uncharacterized protein LOC121369152 isoform X1 [Gigantopelta aegis]